VSERIGLLEQIPLLVRLCDAGVLRCRRVGVRGQSVEVEHDGRVIGRYRLEWNDERYPERAMIIFTQP